jgi:chorismate mutase
MKKGIARPGSDLEKKRREIDQTDRRLLNLLNQRVRLVSEAFAIKKRTGQKLRNLKREREILERLKLENKGPLKEGGLIKIFRAIMGMCRRSQE